VLEGVVVAHVDHVGQLFEGEAGLGLEGDAVAQGALADQRGGDEQRQRPDRLAGGERGEDAGDVQRANRSVGCRRRPDARLGGLFGPTGACAMRLGRRARPLAGDSDCGHRTRP